MKTDEPAGASPAEYKELYRLYQWLARIRREGRANSDDSPAARWLGDLAHAALTGAVCDDDHDHDGHRQTATERLDALRTAHAAPAPDPHVAYREVARLYRALHGLCLEMSDYMNAGTVHVACDRVSQWLDAVLTGDERTPQMDSPYNMGLLSEAYLDAVLKKREHERTEPPGGPPVPTPRETALERELLRVYALLCLVYDALDDRGAYRRPPEPVWLKDTLKNALSGAPVPEGYEQQARDTLDALVPRFPPDTGDAGTISAVSDAKTPEDAPGDAKTPPGAPWGEKPTEIAPGSVWRRNSLLDWAESVEVVVDEVQPWSPGTQIVSYHTLAHPWTVYRAYSDLFRAAYDYVRGPDTPGAAPAAPGERPLTPNSVWRDRDGAFYIVLHAATGKGAAAERDAAATEGPEGPEGHFRLTDLPFVVYRRSGDTAWYVRTEQSFRSRFAYVGAREGR